MDRDKKISFIPQKPIAKEGPVARQPLNIFMVVSVVIFFVTFAAYGGFFFYKRNLEKKVAASLEALKQRKEEIDPSSIIDEARSLQKRISEAKRLVEGHIASSAFFSFLESSTLKSITLTSFQIQEDTSVSSSPATIPQDVPPQAIALGGAGSIPRGTDATTPPRRFQVTVSGVAPSYASLAYQTDVLNEKVESGDIEGYKISNISLNEFGGVNFQLTMTVNAKRIAYTDVYQKRSINGEATTTPATPDGKTEGGGTVSEKIMRDIEAFGLFRF